ncbi:DUF960 family protein [Enterococcus sp. DIV0800]
MLHTKENRYITKEVNEQVPQVMQLRCWQLIDEKIIERRSQQ